MAFTPLLAQNGLEEHEIPPKVRQLAEALGRIHGDVTAVKESGGWHIYAASPAALESDGIRELARRHLAVNADKYFGMGSWLRVRGTYDNDNVALCMKTEKPYRVSDLLAMKPLKERGITEAGSGEVRVVIKERVLIDDGRGNMIPEHPGAVTGILDLPRDHVAVQYLLQRGYNLETLWKQFRCSYCYAETPERRGRFETSKLVYKPLPGGFKDTPQGRIVFYADVDTVQVAWQARYIERMVGAVNEIWHPYEERWVQVKVQIGVDAEGKKLWQLLPPYNTTPPYTWDNPEWDISKYKTARSASRNTMVMGLDAAVAWNKERDRKNTIAIGGEGPLDGGRFGPPALALCGKFLSDEQATLIIRNFKEFVWFGDDDGPGIKATRRVQARLGPKLKLHLGKLPGGKDPGDLRQDVADNLVAPYLNA